MGDRQNAINDLVLREMRAIIATGNWSGPQAVLAESFLSENALYTKLDLVPPHSSEEITYVLNKLIHEKKLYFRQL